MIRPTLLALLLSTWLLGCGEPERPRFVPAGGDAPGGSAAAREPGEGTPRDVVVPKNIPMH